MAMKALRCKNPIVLLTLMAFGIGLLATAFHVHHGREFGMRTRAMTAGLCAAGSEDQPCAPRSHQEGAGCVLCWAASVGAASLISDAPVLPAPRAVAIASRPAIIEAAPRFPRGENFRARGPPA